MAVKKGSTITVFLIVHIIFWQHSPVVVLEEGVFREASSNDRVKFLLAERLP